MRGSHHAPLMPVALGDAHPSRFDGPPRVVGLGFQITDGRFVGPRDLFADPSFDRARATANEVMDYLRRHGPFEPHRLPLTRWSTRRCRPSRPACRAAGNRSRTPCRSPRRAERAGHDAEGAVMTTFTVETLAPTPAVDVRAQVPVDRLPAAFERAFRETMRVTSAQGVAVAGPPFGFYPRPPTDTVEVVAGFPVTADGDVTPFELPGGPVVTGVHTGPYDRLEDTWSCRLSCSSGSWRSTSPGSSASPRPSPGG